MPPEPLVSIITPVRDGARTIGDAIASVQAQSDPAWEHIVVDDGSTDGTAEIVRARADGRLRYVTQAPAGRSAARNHGIDVAAGDCFLFLDADDWLLPNALRDHLRFLAAHPEVGVSVGDGHFCRDDGTPIVRFSARSGPLPSAGVLAGLLLDPGLIAAPLAAMVRAPLVRAHATRFDPDLMIGEDTLFWVEVARHAEFGFHDAVTCKYRWHPANTTLRTSAALRRQQLWQFSDKVLAAPYFAALPESVREPFLQHAIIELLYDRPDEQARALASPAFAALAPAVRARLLRLAASEHLLARRPVELAQRLLRQARELAPGDARARVLSGLLALHPRLARLALRARRRVVTRDDDPLWQHAASRST
jgi:hypothetical protein